MSDPLQAHLDELAERFLELHRRKERLFWETKVGLSEALQEYQDAEVALRRFIGDAARLRSLERMRAKGGTPAQNVVLDGWIQMFRRNVIESPDAQELEREMLALETELERQRSRMRLGYVDPRSGQRVPASSVVLANMVRNDSDEARRRAAWEALCSIEEHVLAHGFAETVKARNRFARALGHADYYEYKVQWAEGFDKATLFGLLDDLEARTCECARRNLEVLAAQQGGNLHPWNHSYLSAGSLAAEQEPYFRFEEALERWGRTFAALGIRYRNALVRVDLVDRTGKYENGFMHAPTPAFFHGGTWVPAEINFTANAVPDQVGSGHNALTTLFHEGGHAAHFANVVTDAPCFSQEFAPTSTAFSETQSMFCDALLRDADWQVRYAHDERGHPIPFQLIRRDIQLRQPSSAFEVRRMLTVSYFEKALYELPDAEVRPDRILDLARSVEKRLLFYEEGAPRPTLAVPHLLSGDSSCYYHGYILAEMAVEQTREHFLDTYGYIVDNPRVGADLANTYWQPGNRISFLDYVPRLTGAPLRADALVRHVTRSASDTVERARQAVERLAGVPLPGTEVDLDVRLEVMHGHETVVPAGRPFGEAAAMFRAWVQANWPRTASHAHDTDAL